jgi:hypothetical protein
LNHRCHVNKINTCVSHVNVLLACIHAGAMATLPSQLAQPRRNDGCETYPLPCKAGGL